MTNQLRWLFLSLEVILAPKFKIVDVWKLENSKGIISTRPYNAELQNEVSVCTNFSVLKQLNMVVFQFEFHPDLNIQDGRGPQIRKT